MKSFIGRSRLDRHTFANLAMCSVSALLLAACGDSSGPVSRSTAGTGLVADTGVPAGSIGSVGSKACILTPTDNGTGYKPLPNAASLPKEIPAPGPEILYRALATAPQLENTGIWSAPPIMVSGASVYRNGEYIYQDFLYDDLGAVPNPESPDPLYIAFATKQSGWGVYKYPADPAYANNAADLLEVRVKPLADSTAFRITYNTMIDPELVGTTIALGTSSAGRTVPHGAAATMPAQMFVTVHGCEGDITDASTGKAISTSPTVAVDLARHQLEVRVPYSVYDTRGLTNARFAVASGLWDAKNAAYLTPPSGSTAATVPNGPTETVPTTGLQNASLFFNVAFRASEPIPVVVAVTDSPGNPPPTNQWMEYQQSHALATGDLSPFYAEVDFTKLAAGTNDDMAGKPGGIPQTGYFNRIHVSHFEDAPGKGNDNSNPVPCNPPSCTHYLAGRLQPYAIYVPTKMGTAGYGLTVQPHGAGDNYADSEGRQAKRQIAERGSGSISITVTGRNLAGWYLGESGAEIFEAWADVASHYPLDPTYNAIHGGSMGGYASYKMAGQFPDLFARSAPYIPCPSAGTEWAQGTPAPGGAGRIIQPLLPNFRNVPVFVWAGASDPICDYSHQQEDRNVIDTLGYRYKFWTLTDSHGLPLYIKFFNDQVFADWLGDFRTDRNPPHVTYVLDGGLYEPEFGLNADHAYWVSGLALRDSTGDPALGQIDVRSHGFGVADAPALATQNGAGVLDGGQTDPVIPYASMEKDWGPAPAEAVADKLDIVTSNVSTMTINVDRARVDCNVTLAVQTDGLLTITLQGSSCNRTVSFLK